MINILLIASSEGVGLTYYLAKLAIVLKKAGNNVVIVSSGKEQNIGLGDKINEEGITHYICPHIDAYFPLGLLLGTYEIIKVFKKEDIDVVHTNAVSQLLKMYFGRLITDKHFPIVISLHSFLPFYMKRLSLLRIICYMADLVMPVCSFTEEYLLKLGLPQNKISTVPNAIDLFEFDNIRHRFQGCICIPGPIIACIAMLYPWKGHYYYLHAAARIVKDYPNARFLVIGGGPLRSELEALAKNLRIDHHVLFLGQLRNDEVPSLLNNIDIIICPSLQEQFPLNILESMAAKKPIIATSVGCVPRIIEEIKSGLLVPPSDPEALAKSIRILIQNPDLAKQMGLHARNIIEEKFSFDVIQCRLIYAYYKSMSNYKSMFSCKSMSTLQGGHRV